jgi:uncharacterized protein YprB with RNaseH-like and TPR domain
MIFGAALKARLGELARSRSTSATHADPEGRADGDVDPEGRADGDGTADGAPRRRPRSERSQDGGASEDRAARAGCPSRGPSLGAPSAGPSPAAPWEFSSSQSPLNDLLALRSEPHAVGVEAFLPGGEWRDERGAVYVHERLRSDVERRRHHWGTLGEAPEKETEIRALTALGLEHALFLDLETGGLSSSPVFLAGTMHWNGTDFVLRQYFARHYGEEATLLGALADATRGFEFLVTFNGKSYDVPFLRDRGNVHRVRLTLPPRHVDLLHPARRRWKLELPDCRLQTLEYRVCRRRRVGDVPGDEVPGLYHDYVRNGDPYRLVPVFHHNLLDVTTMGDVLAALCR